MKTLLYVAIGGGIGTCLRFGLNQLLKPETAGAFPMHTFIINIVGCLVIGLTFAFIKKQIITDPLLIVGITTGILGGFTTFSSYAMESIQLIEARKNFMVIMYILLSNVLGLVAAWLGYHLHKLLS